MKIIKPIVMFAMASFMAIACAEEMPSPADGMPSEGQKVKFCISADFPEISPDSKVILNDSEALT